MIPLCLCRMILRAVPLLLAVAAPLISAGPARSAEFIDAAGRVVMLPRWIGHVLPAERNAEVLVFVLAPDRLAGLGSAKLLKRPARTPVLGWGPRSTPASMAATARQVHADLIIDAGTVTADRAAFADQVQKQAGIPYVLIDGGFARMPATMRSIGTLLDVTEEARHLARDAEHAIAGLRGRLLIRPANARPHVYYGRGDDGLTTALPGSPAGAAIEEAGALNVAASLGRGGEVAVTRDQLFGWNPEIIIAERRGFYESVRRNPAWRHLPAVRNKRVYLEPGNPFGWIADPAGINRLIGLYWLSSLLYPDATQEDLRETTCDFYAKFYRIKLTNAQLEALLRPAGVAPAETVRPVGEPLVGLGAAPPSTSAAASATAATPSATPVAPPQTPSPAPEIPAAIGEGGPNAVCTVPGAASALPYAGLTPAPGASPDNLPPAAVPGVPPPGRRGRPPG